MQQPSASAWLAAQLKPFAARAYGQQLAALLAQLCWLGFLWLFALQLASLWQASSSQYLTWLALLLLARLLLLSLEHALGQSLGHRISASVRQQLLSHWQRQGPGLAQQLGKAKMANQAMQAVEDLRPYYQHYLRDRTLAMLLPILMLPWIWWHNWLAGLLLLLTWPLIPLFMSLIGMGAERINLAWRQQQDRLAGYFIDRLQGLSSLRWAGLIDRERALLQETSLEYRDLSMKTLRVAFLSSAVLEFFSAVAIATLAIYIGLSLLGMLDWPVAQQWHYGLGLAVLLWAPEFFAPLRTWGQSYHDRAKALASAEQLQQQLATQVRQQGWQAHSACGTELKPHNLSDTELKPHNLSGTELKPHNLSGTELKPHNLSGTELMAELQLVRDGSPLPLPAIRLQLQPGQLLWVRGQSGRGKTTLLHSLAALLPVNGSLVLPVAKQLAWLGQRPWLEPGTLRANLSLLAPEASEQQMRDALAQVGLGPLVDSLPQGLDAELGDAGQGLSGGQAQRLALARLLLSPAPLMFLDEPSQYLDAHSWARLLPLLRELSNQGRILVVASHDPSLASIADLVLDLDQQAAAGQVLQPLPIPKARDGLQAMQQGSRESQTGIAGVAAMPSTAVMDSLPAMNSQAAMSEMPEMPVEPLPPTGPRLLLPWLRQMSSHRGAWLMGGLLLLLTLLSGMGLLAASGWFLTLTALSGLGILLLKDLFTPSTIIRALALLRTLSRYGERLLHHHLILGLLAQMRASLFASLLALPSHRTWRLKGLHWWQRLTQDLDALDQLYLRAILPPLLAWLLTLLLAALLYLFAPLLAWPVLLAALLLPMLWLAMLPSARAAEQRRQQQGLQQSLYHQASSLAEQDLAALSQGQWQGKEQAAIKAGHALAAQQHLANQLLLLLQGLILLYWLMALPQLELQWAQWPLLVALLLGFLALSEAWQGVSNSTLAWQQAMISAQALALPQAQAEQSTKQFTELAVKPQAARSMSSTGGSDGCKSGAKAALESGLVLSNLGLRYPQALSPIVQQLNWQLPDKGLLLLLGPSGSGKSSLLGLLQAELQPSCGQITWQGRPIKDWPLASWREQYALLEQRPHLFQDSAQFNLSLGQQVEPAKQAKVLQQLGLHSWWQSTQQGQVLLADQGLGLSEGQLRRLALARVLLNPRPLMLLDEPLASLDQDSQQGVIQAIQDLAAHSLVIVAQHQPEPWPAATRQLWLN